MLLDDIKSVDGAWGSIGMSRPEYLAWERIKKFCEEALKPSHNSRVMPCQYGMIKCARENTEHCANCQPIGFVSARA
jgi:hypothetical protein